MIRGIFLMACLQVSREASLANKVFFLIRFIAPVLIRIIDQRFLLPGSYLYLGYEKRRVIVQAASRICKISQFSSHVIKKAIRISYPVSRETSKRSTGIY
ncbi:unnamed protein product [Rhizophagus irregularis]|uniref:Uncharacterized protein n=1 Tax=Rhizophagus irregularis TaxID=588596 RepID=A0A915YY55_9GLOM|nr:unnamed protein product [Rhizophagus irregularis]